MELVKDIFFNTDKLVENTPVKISYTGTLFQNGSEEVFLHHGFEDDWKETNEIKMEKTDLGFQAELTLPEYTCLNFCLRNYTFCIEKPEMSLVTIEENTQLAKHKGLRKTYLWSKKIKLAVYKIIKFFPKVITGNYKKKVTD